MKLSGFGEKFAGHSGIVQLMDDLGKAMAENKEMLMLGGGNPSHIPEVQKLQRPRRRSQIPHSTGRSVEKGIRLGSQRC